MSSGGQSLDFLREYKTLSEEPADLRSQQIDQIIADYLEEVESGGTPCREHLFDQYPAFAQELRSFFAEHDRTGAARMCIDERTLPPRQADAETTPPDAPLESSDSPRNTADAHGGEATMPFAGQSDDAPPVGETVRCFGDYELLQEIDRGGMGVVYKARQISLHRTVALKMILAGQLASEDDVKRFHAEAEAAACLDHPGIVPIFEVGQHDGQHYFSMGFVEGQSLAQRLADGCLPSTEAAELTRKVAEAVSYAHEQGVIHRDLKPANILLSRSHEPSSARAAVRPGDAAFAATDRAVCTCDPRVTDFGLAKRVEIESRLTASGQTLGTPSYMPPEQASGKHAEIGPASDVYSLGAVLFELLTGRPPFQAGTPMDTVIQVLEGEPPLPRSLNHEIDRNLETICLKCLQKDPQRRYGSAHELADDLDRYLHGEPITARPFGLLGRVARWARHKPALAVTLAALFALYVNHLVILFAMNLPSEGGTFHWFVTGLVLVWGFGAMLMQWLTSRPSWEVPSIYAWAAMEVVLFTGFLFAANGPSSAMVIGYLLLIAASVLRNRPVLTWCVTAISVVSYLSLVADAHWSRPQLAVPVYHSVYYVLSECVMGLLMHLVLRRVRTATSNDTNYT